MRRARKRAGTNARGLSGKQESRLPMAAQVKSAAPHREVKGRRTQFLQEFLFNMVALPFVVLLLRLQTMLFHGISHLTKREDRKSGHASFLLGTEGLIKRLPRIS